MRRFIMTAFVALGVLASCTTDQIETPENTNSLQVELQQLDTQTNQTTTRDLDPTDTSRFDCIESAPCDSMVYPTHSGGFGFVEEHIWYESTMTLEDIECHRSAYFRCFTGYIFMKTWQPSDPYHDIWIRDFGKPDLGLDSTTDDDPRVCNNPTNSCD